MDDKTFRAFLDLMMCSDPWPVTDQGEGTGQEVLIQLAHAEAYKRGYEGWIDAFHYFKPIPDTGAQPGGQPKETT